MFKLVPGTRDRRLRLSRGPKEPVELSSSNTRRSFTFRRKSVISRSIVYFLNIFFIWYSSLKSVNSSVQLCMVCKWLPTRRFHSVLHKWVKCFYITDSIWRGIITHYIGVSWPGFDKNFKNLWQNILKYQKEPS